ncbi:PREDICTED: E3 ubiquitin/ISG15 ligase TRIM25 [Tinamus guttatus]|uniref:E3 ubiquitin/ISG15 ligase TRIM25 n=1 Tax=Tinamus guttatus TaxID=94827 RepID=UPI00052E7FE7|nr:PREDICTED: E3 ubiquitin/ISG15 ligase TRIM25 [Tinamus guttatus]
MASFCAEHLRPHKESPAFRDHQLCPPLPDLQQRKCASHNKLLELFCREHATCICSTCILSHRLCHTTPLQQAREEAEAELKKKLTQTQNQSRRAAQTVTLVKENQSHTARAAALQQVTTKDVFTPKIEMDQSLIDPAYQSAINIKETVKLAVTQSLDKSAEAPKPAAPNAAAAAATKQLIESFLKKPREELLQYAASITLDYNTAHNQVVLSDNYTKMCVSETPLNYSDHPQRFTYCSQVLGFQCFKRGIHYWEVDLQHSNFCGIGVCYGSMKRQGAESRLGRNSRSWCIEWFSNKISAWHDDVEKCLPNTKASRVGVLLHCDQGFVIFLAVGERHNLIYKYKTQFTEALYPAFWVFSSGTVLSLCQLKP